MRAPFRRSFVELSARRCSRRTTTENPLHDGGEEEEAEEDALIGDGDGEKLSGRRCPNSFWACVSTATGVLLVMVGIGLAIFLGRLVSPRVTVKSVAGLTGEAGMETRVNLYNHNPYKATWKDLKVTLMLNAKGGSQRLVDLGRDRRVNVHAYDGKRVSLDTDTVYPKALQTFFKKCSNKGFATLRLRGSAYGKYEEGGPLRRRSVHSHWQKVKCPE